MALEHGRALHPSTSRECGVRVECSIDERCTRLLALMRVESAREAPIRPLDTIIVVMHRVRVIVGARACHSQARTHVHKTANPCAVYMKLSPGDVAARTNAPHTLMPPIIQRM